VRLERAARRVLILIPRHDRRKHDQALTPEAGVADSSGTMSACPLGHA
jgi:hypothetical protein